MQSMMTRADHSTENRLRTALELCDLGEELTEQRLRRENPSADDRAIKKLLTDWYAIRPGAEQGDAIGRPGTWPRSDSRT